MKLNTQGWLWGTLMAAMLVWAPAGCAQSETKAPVKTPGLSSEELMRMLADKSVAGALVFGKDGKITGFGGNSKPLERCQLCTPELEAKLGKNCLGDGKPEYAKDLAALTPKLCEGAGAPQTSIKGISTVTAIHHSGTDCYTYYICDDTGCYVYQYCW